MAQEAKGDHGQAADNAAALINETAMALAKDGKSGEARGGGYGMWPLTEESREKIVQRIASNLAAISFFSSSAASSSSSPVQASSAFRLDDEAAREHALVIEREAFVSADAQFEAAQGGASTTPGSGIPAESAVVLAYAQHASDAMIALLKAKIIPPASSSSSSAVFQQSLPGTKEAVSVAALEDVLDLSKDGKREFLGKERAAELLEPMLRSNPSNHVKVRLSTKSFKPEACAAVARALQNAAETLKHADLSDIIAGQPEEQALAALTEISGALQGVPLLSLDLSNNALGEKGVRACAPALTTQRCLEELYFCNNGISEEAGEAIVELLPTECALSLRTLHFHNNMSGDAGATALAQLVAAAAASRLRDFRFSSTRVGTDGAIALADALRQGSSLEKLDLRDNPFAEEGGLALANSLSSHPQLQELYLADTCLGDDSAKAVVTTLAKNCTDLKVLDLAGNELTAEGARDLASGLEGLPGLRRLVLSENELQDKGAAIIAAALAASNKDLEELDLCTNEISDTGAKAAAEAACKLPNLRVLNLNGNSISKAAVEEIKELLASDCSRGVSVLGPLDENDDGEEDEEE